MRALLSSVAASTAAVLLLVPGQSSQAVDQLSAAPAPSCQAAKQTLSRTKDQAGAVYRAEVRTARKEFKVSRQTKADKRELAAHINDSKQARRALIARAKDAVRAKC